MADDPLLVKSVIQALAKRYGTTQIHRHICSDCALQEADNARDAVSLQRDERGHYVLSGDQEQYGYAPYEEGSVPSVVRKNQRGKESPVTTATETPQTNEPAAPAEQPKESRADRLRRELPPGTLVEFEKTEWKGNQGKVTGVEERRGVAYTAIDVEVYADGRRREGVAVKHVLVREGSTRSIGEYRAEPTKAAPAAEEGASES
jgi:hypothetical protein